jgi:PilZ domain
MRERRKADRFSLNYYTSILNAETNQKVGNVMDISAQGIMLVTDTPIPIGETIHLKLPLEEDIFGRQTLEFKVLSIWCHPDIEPHSYNVGLEILDIAQEDIETISHIAVRYGV